MSYITLMTSPTEITPTSCSLLRTGTLAICLTPVVNDAKHVALAEDTHETSGLINYRKRPDVVLDELGNGLADGRLRVNRNNAATFGIKDVSNQHEIPPGYGAWPAFDPRVHRPALAT
jgi:hypothetical protein